MAGISQIIRWRQGRAVISHRSVQQKARSGDAAAASSSASANPAPQPSTKVSLTGATQAANATYLDKLKRKAKAGLQGTRINALNRETRATSGAVPATDGASGTLQQSLREALSQFAALAEPAPPPELPPARESSAAAPPSSGDGLSVAVSWDVDATYEWDTLMQDAQHARKEEADNNDASEAPPTPASA